MIWITDPYQAWAASWGKDCGKQAREEREMRCRILKWQESPFPSKRLWHQGLPFRGGVFFFFFLWGSYRVFPQELLWESLASALGTEINGDMPQRVWEWLLSAFDLSIWVSVDNEIKYIWSSGMCPIFEPMLCMYPLSDTLGKVGAIILPIF